MTTKIKIGADTDCKDCKQSTKDLIVKFAKDTMDCKDCKHWQKFMKFIKEWGYCEIMRDKIIHETGIGTGSSYYTIEDFGCKFWERYL